MFQVMQISPQNQLEFLKRVIRKNLTKEHRKENRQGRQYRGMSEESMSQESSIQKLEQTGLSPGLPIFCLWVCNLELHRGYQTVKE